MWGQNLLECSIPLHSSRTTTLLICARRLANISTFHTILIIYHHNINNIIFSFIMVAIWMNEQSVYLLGYHFIARWFAWVKRQPFHST